MHFGRPVELVNPCQLIGEDYGVMSRLITSAERIQKASQLIKQAFLIPVPEIGGKFDFSYIARVKDLLQQARDLVKFIPKTPTATEEMKDQVRQIMAAADQANREILH
jgi:S-adenosylmethionine synthetase